MPLQIPGTLAANCRKSPEGTAWLASLPAVIQTLEQMWSLELDPAFDSPDVTASFVAPARRGNGTISILKIGKPHFEALHEIHGLRFWSGNPTVQLLEADADLNAMLIERCEPGASLRELPEPEQDNVIAMLLRRLWREPAKPNPFRPLLSLTSRWSEETLAQKASWPDEGLVREGLRVFHDLPRSAPTEVLLATDLHAGNVLRAQREPWLVIDPKPFIGDPAYDATQHLFNCLERLRANPTDTIRRFSDLLAVDYDRIRLWLFARAAAEPREDWQNPDSLHLARDLASL
jgi:streptomycin 6-kinase